MTRVAFSIVWVLASAFGVSAAMAVPLDPSHVPETGPPGAPELPVARRVADMRPMPMSRFTGPVTTVVPFPAAESTIRLSGVLGGARPGVLLDGLPGSTGTVVLSPNESFGDATLLAVRAGEAVLLVGSDTLRLRLIEER